MFLNNASQRVQALCERELPRLPRIRLALPPPTCLQPKEIVLWVEPPTEFHSLESPLPATACTLHQALTVRAVGGDACNGAPSKSGRLGFLPRSPL